ncbi:MAG: Leucine carboxyl methyltransferase [Methanoregula sp. PtaU1.Bin051]|nr:MAG: Leucine carboxyl methyltransferase [Methanoregula sp. PtaU1.Bin051]
MKEECDRVCPWYGEVTLNRKWFIRHFVSGIVSSLNEPCQIIIPAAGKSPLALELLDAFTDRIERVIETDITGMAEKHQIYARTAPEHAGRIRCVTADLFDRTGTFRAIVSGGGYDPGSPSVIILEGISYYIPQKVLSGAASLFASAPKRNTIVVESLLPCRLVNREKRHIPKGIWDIIIRMCCLEKTMTYSPEEMEQTLRSAGCDRIRHYPMHDIERSRTGTNRYFPTPADGWIQVTTGRL